MATCIAGMHRSGTSMVARALHEAGLYLGEEPDLMRPGPDNPEGFWERTEVVAVNDALTVRVLLTLKDPASIRTCPASTFPAPGNLNREPAPISTVSKSVKVVFAMLPETVTLPAAFSPVIVPTPEARS